MQDVDEERVVLQEVVRLQAAAVSNPKVSKKFVVVGWKEKKKIETKMHLFWILCRSFDLFVLSDNILF